VLSTITSRPNARRIVCDAGRKAMSIYGAVPEPIDLPDVQSVAVHGEHAVIELTAPNDDLAPGDRLAFAVGHADLTVHLHDELYGVRQDRVEAVWPIWARAAFR
jgi:D-serine deaminase-like pyridoxal phosphate-dependent protein